MDLISRFFAWLNAVPAPGAHDPLLTLWLLIVILALGLAGLFTIVVWPLDGSQYTSRRDKGGFNGFV